MSSSAELSIHADTYFNILKTEYLSNLEHLYNWEYASSAFANATGPVAPTANATMMAMMA